MSARLVGSRWHLTSARGSSTVCGKPIHLTAYRRELADVPKSRWCKTCLGAVGIIVSLSEAHMELKAKESAS